MTEADAAYGQAQPLREQLARDYPRVIEYQYALADFLHKRGSAYYMHAQPTQAEAAFQKSIEILERLTREHPTILHFAITLAEDYYFVGILWRERGDHAATLVWFDRNITVLEQVLRTEPRHVTARAKLAGTHMHRAESLSLMGRPQDTRKDWERAIALGEGQTHAELRILRAMALAHCGEHGRATNEVEAMLQKGEGPFQDFYQFACVHSAASAAASKDRRLTPADQSRLAEQYAARAVMLLVKAHTAGLFNDQATRKWVKQDPDLDAVRSRDDFKKFISELEQDAKGSPGKP
jgi:tetratricopeptide (TPR) repeat protein